MFAHRVVAALILVVGVAPAGAQPSPSEAGAAGAAPVTALGSYEQAALDRALAARRLELDPAPAGKRVGRIHVVNLDVFGGDEAWMTWANALHVTTKEEVIAREVLLRPGDPWDEERADESRRRLRDPLFTTLVVIVPVKAAAAATVDLLVVTRDIWSLRLNSRWELQESVLSELSLSLSENNIFGLRKQAAFVFDMDLGSFALGPQFVDKNLGGSHLTLVSKLGAIFARETGEFEGTRSFTSFAYPLWSLERRWGASLSESHFDGVTRYFQGAEPFTYDDPDTAEVEAVPVEYGIRTFALETSGVRQFGAAIKQRVTVGHELRVVRPRLLDDFPADATLRAAFTRDLFPRSERASSLFVRYGLFTPRFVVYRDLDSYDLPEDIRLGPELNSELAVARELIGSERDFLATSLGGAWTFDLAGDGFVRPSFGLGGRLEDGELVDRVVSGTLSAASPALAGLRVVGRANLSARFHDANNQFFALGGQSGLRGYPIDLFRGDRMVVTNLEVRTRPVRVLFARAGLLAFWDMGHAADRFGELDLHHDFGLGARMLVPQLQPYVFRFDWAVASEGPTAGLPGRFTAGVQQVF